MQPKPRPKSPLLTSTEVAERLDVTPSSVKRWASSGQLPCRITAGGHRRFARADVEAFARGRDVHSDAPPRDALVEALISDRPVWAIQSAIVERRASASSWYATADDLGRACSEIGACWARGELSILEEHRATERFTRALAACAETIVLSQSAPRALLATAEGDEHTLALHLAELCLREAGWNVEWCGRSSPGAEILARIERGGIGLVGLSASSHSRDARALEAQVRRLHGACRRVHAHLVLGGEGAWPSLEAFSGGDVHRVRRFEELHELLVGSAV